MALPLRRPRLGRLNSGLLLALAFAFLPAPAGAAQPAAEPFPFRFYANRGGDFALTDQQGQPWNLEMARGKVVLLNFGYTHCPDICPASLGTLSAARRDLGTAGGTVQTVFVTLDAARDTPQRLSAYLAIIDDGLIGLTGSQDAVEGVARQYNVKFQSRDGGPNLGLTIDHSAFIYLIDRQGRLRYLFPHTTPPQRLAEAARQLLDATP